MRKKWITASTMLLIATLSFAQGGDEKSKTKQLEDAAWARAGCGPDATRFNVKMDKHQHTLAVPESGKALVYVFEQDLTRGSLPTTRVGVEGKWIGGNVPDSYLFFSVTAGAHRLCSNWQGYPADGAALDFTAESGKSYFFRARISLADGFSLQPVTEAEGHFLIASYGLATSAEKPRNEDNQP
jgi:hypothetical protein